MKIKTNVIICSYVSAHIKKDKYYISISCNDIYEPVSSCLE